MNDIYQSRIQSLTEVASADLILITNPTNVYYFTGCFIDPHERFLGLLVNTNTNETTLVFPKLDSETVKKHAHVQHQHPYEDGDDVLSNVQSLTSSQTIQIEGDHVTYHRYLKIRKQYNENEIASIDHIIHQLRGQKSEHDIVELKKAVAITETALREVIDAGVIGRTEKEISDALLDKVKQLGAVDVSFGPIVLTGANSALPHGESGDTVIEEGHFLLIDFGVITKTKFISDMTRTFIIGEPTEQQKEIYESVLESNVKGIEASVPGTILKDLDQASRDIINDKGYGPYFTHRLGHGLGLGLHELPSIDGRNSDTLKAGNVITVEPGIYITGVGGVRIEDMVYVSRNTEVLTSFDKALEEIVLKK